LLPWKVIRSAMKRQSEGSGLARRGTFSSALPLN
jgi:hypothetical protein